MNNEVNELFFQSSLNDQFWLQQNFAAIKQYFVWFFGFLRS